MKFKNFVFSVAYGKIL